MDENNAQVLTSMWQVILANFGSLVQDKVYSLVQQDKSSNLEWLKETDSEKSDQSASSFGLWLARVGVHRHNV